MKCKTGELAKANRMGTVSNSQTLRGPPVKVELTNHVSGNGEEEEEHRRLCVVVKGGRIPKTRWVCEEADEVRTVTAAVPALVVSGGDPGGDGEAERSDSAPEL